MKHQHKEWQWIFWSIIIGMPVVLLILFLIINVPLHFYLYRLQRVFILRPVGALVGGLLLFAVSYLGSWLLRFIHYQLIRYLLSGVLLGLIGYSVLFLHPRLTEKQQIIDTVLAFQVSTLDSIAWDPAYERDPEGKLEFDTPERQSDITSQQQVFFVESWIPWWKLGYVSPERFVQFATEHRRFYPAYLGEFDSLTGRVKAPSSGEYGEVWSFQSVEWIDPHTVHVLFDTYSGPLSAASIQFTLKKNSGDWAVTSTEVRGIS